MTTERRLLDPPERKAEWSLFTCWWGMNEAHLECAGLPPIDDGELVLHFSGSGASCMVFAKDIRLVCKILNAAKEVAQSLRLIEEGEDQYFQDLADKLEGA